MNLFVPRPHRADPEPHSDAPPEWREFDSDWHAGAETEPVEPGPDARPRRGRRALRLGVRGLALAIVLLVVAVGWLAVTAPLSRSLKPPAPPSVTLLADDGTPIARRGAVVGAPVSVATLPPQVPQAFLAIEDRRFYHHGAIDPRGIARALFRNVAAGGVREGGSTITQQLAKNAFLDNDRTAGRKLREVMIAFWLEAWLSKDQILSRYLSNVYFGDNVYGLSAAARHYFDTTPAHLTLGQAAMLAGLVKAPSRLAPTGNPAGATARMRVVLRAMADAGFVTRARADAVADPDIAESDPNALPSGTYFADWVLPAAREAAGEARGDTSVTTTLDPHYQHLAERIVAHAGLAHAQAALVAMRPDGRVVAMVGGRDYGHSPFNRATQALRQPGSAFKLFVYLAALRDGMTPDSIVEDRPVDIAGWRPHNADGRYLGPITLRQAFARSSNVAAARLIKQVGPRAVIKAARDLGVTTPLANEATIALGTQAMSLLELTAAYAAVADGRYPVAPRGLEAAPDKGWLHSITGGPSTMPANVRDGMMELLRSSLAGGTGRAATLSITAYGKTGTTQDSRDALFVGFAKDLVVGVWVGNDDNAPIPGLSGGGAPARIWQSFMTQALGLAPVEQPRLDEGFDPDAEVGGVANGIDAVGDLIGNAIDGGAERLRGLGLDLRVGRDGDVELDRAPPPRERPPRGEPGDRDPREGDEEE